MKSVLAILLFVLSLQFTFAQDVSESQVPEKIKNSFTKEFQSTKANWSKEEAGYEASFKKDGKELSIVFDLEGAVMERETEIQKSDLPAFVNDYVSTNYPKFKLKEIARIESTKGNFFEVEVAKGSEVYEFIFDSQTLVEKKNVDDKD